MSPIGQEEYRPIASKISVVHKMSKYIPSETVGVNKFAQGRDCKELSNEKQP